jgi:NAD(P)H-nitrite reductase large subunit
VDQGAFLKFQRGQSDKYRRTHVDSIAHRNLESIKWADFKNLTYKRLFFKDGRLVGAVLIGEMKGHRRLRELIARRTRLEPCERPRLLEAAG